MSASAIDLLVDDARKIAGRKTGAYEWIAVCHPTGWGLRVAVWARSPLTLRQRPGLPVIFQHVVPFL
jgi:hypothetical protein